MHGISSAIVAPTVPARTRKGELKAAAAERLAGDVLRVGAVEHQKRPDAPGQGRLPADVPHATQVPLAFLTYVGDEDQAGAAILNRRRSFESARDRQQRSAAGAVIGVARTSEASLRSQAKILQSFPR